jgi:hypothetical protein
VAYGASCGAAVSGYVFGLGYKIYFDNIILLFIVFSGPGTNETFFFYIVAGMLIVSERSFCAGWVRHYDRVHD